MTSHHRAARGPVLLPVLRRGRPRAAGRGGRRVALPLLHQELPATLRRPGGGAVSVTGVNQKLSNWALSLGPRTTRRRPTREGSAAHAQPRRTGSRGTRGRLRRGRHPLGDRHVRRPDLHHLLDVGRGDRAPRVRDQPGHRRGVPRHRLPLPRDDRHQGRGRRRLPGQPGERDARRGPSPSRTPSSGRGCTGATPTCAATCARSSRSSGRWRGYDAWITGVRREETLSRRDTRVVEFDEKRQMVKVNPIVAWTSEQVDEYIASQRRAGQPAGLRRLPVDRLPDLHDAGRGGRGPAVRPVGRDGQDRMRHPRLTLASRPASARRRRLSRSRTARRTRGPRPRCSELLGVVASRAAAPAAGSTCGRRSSTTARRRSPRCSARSTPRSALPAPVRRRAAAADRGLPQQGRHPGAARGAAARRRGPGARRPLRGHARPAPAAAGRARAAAARGRASPSTIRRRPRRDQRGARGGGLVRPGRQRDHRRPGGRAGSATGAGARSCPRTRRPPGPRPAEAVARAVDPGRRAGRRRHVPARPRLLRGQDPRRPRSRPGRPPSPACSAPRPRWPTSSWTGTGRRRWPWRGRCAAMRSFVAGLRLQ